MKTSWTSGLTPQESAEVKADYAQAQQMRKRLSAILQKKVDSSRTYKIDKERYDSPSWGFLQADSCGYERALREILSLIE